MKWKGTSIAGLAILATLFAPAAGATAAPNCSAPLPQGSEQVQLDPADFVATIDNPYWPMAVGSKWVATETRSSTSSRNGRRCRRGS